MNNHIKPGQKASTSSFTFFGSFYQITVKNRHITHLIDVLRSKLLPKVHDFWGDVWHPSSASVFTKPFGDQLRSKAQYENASAQKRACVPRNVPACLKMVLPAPKLQGHGRPCSSAASHTPREPCLQQRAVTLTIPQYASRFASSQIAPASQEHLPTGAWPHCLEEGGRTGELRAFLDGPLTALLETITHSND